jgi:hypothetical protein
VGDHTYYAPSNYTVAVRASDANGCLSAASVVVSVLGQISEFLLNASVATAVGLVLVFTLMTRRKAVEKNVSF